MRLSDRVHKIILDAQCGYRRCVGRDAALLRLGNGSNSIMSDSESEFHPDSRRKYNEKYNQLNENGGALSKGIINQEEGSDRKRLANNCYSKKIFTYSTKKLNCPAHLYFKLIQDGKTYRLSNIQEHEGHHELFELSFDFRVVFVWIVYLEKGLQKARVACAQERLLLYPPPYCLAFAQARRPVGQGKPGGIRSAYALHPPPPSSRKKPAPRQAEHMGSHPAE
ncbi:unnamed protein product [Trichogramma brassicae]|uniref:Uncharacterized protein n=1 Tax=Trichogramma brassicae TaxID=86971 RepID=A0A6H5HY51_9HYME|nr:unnamed protein product [Trichogramma brassicae]